MREQIISQMHSGTERIFACAGLIGAASASFVVRDFNPATAGFFPVCPLFALTGIACPGCGLTRAFHALFNGDIFGALDYNALFPFYAVAFGYFVIAMISIAIRGKSPGFTIFKPWVLWSFLSLSMFFGILRNIPVYPFNILAP